MKAISLDPHPSYAMAAIAEEVATTLRHLSADGTLEDVQNGLYVLEKVERGLIDVEAGHTLMQEEVEQRLAKWLNG